MYHPSEIDYQKAGDAITEALAGKGQSVSEAAENQRRDMPLFMWQKLTRVADLINDTGIETRAFRSSVCLGVLVGALLADEAYAPQGVAVSDIFEKQLDKRDFMDRDSFRKLVVSMGARGLFMIGSNAREWVDGALEYAEHLRPARIATGLVIYNTHSIYEDIFNNRVEHGLNYIRQVLEGLHDTDVSTHIRRLLIGERNTH